MRGIIRITNGNSNRAARPKPGKSEQASAVEIERRKQMAAGERENSGEGPIQVSVPFTQNANSDDSAVSGEVPIQMNPFG